MNYWWDLILRSSFSVRMLIFLVVILFLLSTTMFIYVYFLRTSRERKQKIFNRVKDEVQNKLLESVGIHDENIIPEIPNYPTNRKVYQLAGREAFSSIADKFSGPGFTHLRNIFLQTQFFEHLKNDLHINRDWQLISLAIREAYMLELHELSPIIEPLMKSKFSMVRSEVRLFLVRVQGVSALKEVFETGRVIDDWQQFKIIHELKRHGFTGRFGYAKYLASELPSVRRFATRLISYFNVVGYDRLLINHITDVDYKTSKLALHALNKSKNKQVGFTIRLHFDYLPFSSKEIALSILANLGGKENVIFIKQLLASKDQQIVLYAAKAWIAIDKDIPLFENVPPESVPIIKIVEDARMG